MRESLAGPHGAFSRATTRRFAAKKVVAAGFNYKSHIGDASVVHYEAEICVVTGTKAQLG